VKFKPKPDGWVSDLDGEWEDQPGALIHIDHEDNEEEKIPSTPALTRGRGRGRGRGASTIGRGAAAKKLATSNGRGKKKAVEDDNEDIIMLDDEDEEVITKPSRGGKKPAAAKKAPTRAAAASATRQTKLNLIQLASPANGTSQMPQELVGSLLMYRRSC
jgi:double-strand break repair protein MRE11